MTQQAWIAAGQGLLTSSQNWLNQQIATRQAEADREFQRTQQEDYRKWIEGQQKAELDRAEEDDLRTMELKASAYEQMAPFLAGQGQAEWFASQTPETQVMIGDILGPTLIEEWATGRETARAEAQQVELFDEIAPFLSVQGVQSLEGLAMLHSLGVPVIDPLSYESIDEALMRNVQRDQNIFQYAGFRGHVMGQTAEDTIARLEAMGITGVDTAWVEKTVDMYRQMNTPRGGVGVGGAGGAGGDVWAVFNEFNPNVQRQIQQLAIQGNSSIPDVISGGIAQGIITFDELGNPSIDPQGWELYASQRGIEIPISAEPTQAPQAEVAFYVGLLETMDLRSIETDINNRADLTEAQKANLISAIRRETGVGEGREPKDIMLGI